jgi:hypothetical protein
VGGPLESSNLDVQAWHVSASWSCAAPPAWDPYVADLDRELKRYQRRSTSPRQVTFARYEPGDYYLLTIAAVTGSADRIEVRFIAGPD